MMASTLSIDSLGKLVDVAVSSAGTTAAATGSLQRQSFAQVAMLVGLAAPASARVQTPDVASANQLKQAGDVVKIAPCVPSDSITITPVPTDVVTEQATGDLDSQVAVSAQSKAIVRTTKAAPRLMDTAQTVEAQTSRPQDHEKVVAEKQRGTNVKHIAVETAKEGRR
ncbi:hypothetical protein ACFQBQ_01500 [Granulicella cerasi]|uniref:Uncharacterized protein n=1 Tax=Granulicella cerasi TaxID=741063 RepID=A0ABW1Z561_9BACT